MKLAAVRFSITQRAVCGCRAEEGFTRAWYDMIHWWNVLARGWMAG